MTRKPAAITLVLLGTAGVFLGCDTTTQPTTTDTARSGYRYRSHSVIFIPRGGSSGGSVSGAVGGGGGRSFGTVSPGRSGFGRSGSVGS